MANSQQWTAEEGNVRQALEARLRHLPGDRETMINLATLLASKLELKEARNLLGKAAVGINNDKKCASLLRKLATGKLAIWRGMRNKKNENQSYVSKDDSCDFIYTGPERKEVALEAVEFFEQAMCHQENSSDPVALIEGANGKLAVGELMAALKDYSSIIANFPDYPKLNTAIYKAACLLMVLGEREQAKQYLAHILDDPPMNVGAGEFEIRALLIICQIEAPKVNKETIRKMYTVLSDALLRCEIRKELPDGFAAIPPKGTVFAKWAAPWKLLVDRMLARCDYVAAAEFLRMLLRKEKSAETFVLMGEVRFMLGDTTRALEAMETAYEMNPSFLPAQEHLLEWDNETWAPRLDAAAYAAKVAREKAEEIARRHAIADLKGRVLKAHVERQRMRLTLEEWYNTWELSYAATLIQRIARGYITRTMAVKKAKENEILKRRTIRVVKKINAHLLRHVVRSWNRYWRTIAAERRKTVKPLARKINNKLLKIVFNAWHHRARRQINGRVTAKRAMRGLKKWTGRGRRRVTVSSDEIPVFYSKSLNSLASFPLDKSLHEVSIRHVVEEKIRTAELLAESQAKAELEARLREEQEALEAAAAAAEAEEGGEETPQDSGEFGGDGGSPLGFGSTAMGSTTEVKTPGRKQRVQIAPEPLY